MDELEADLKLVWQGDRPATERLIRALTPVVQARAYGVLSARGGRATGRDVRLEVEDATQEILFRIFDGNGRVLRDWDRAKGLSLVGFVGLIAHRLAGHIVASKSRSPWSQIPTDHEVVGEMMGESDAGSRGAEARNLIGRLWGRLKEELTPKGRILFWDLFLEDKSVAEVCDEHGMQQDAVHAWRSRLMKRARSIADEFAAAGESSSVSLLSSATSKESTP